VKRIGSSVDWLWLASIVLALTCVHLVAGKLPCTGDETRYAFQGLGLVADGSFYPEPKVWERFSAASNCGNGGVLPSDQRGRPLQTISASVVFGPALRVGGLEAARWLNFVIGCAALALLYVTLKMSFAKRSGGGRLSAVVAVGAIALSIPFAPYLQLIYPEILLFATVTAAVYGLASGRRYVTLASAVLLPFLHVRALPLAVALFAVLLFQMARDRVPPGIWTRTCALYAAGFGIFAALQCRLFGSLTGSAFPAYSPALSLVFERVGMQLYGVRHGAIAYAPLLLVALAGLALGTMRRERLCGYSLVLFVTYFATFMWSTAQESWTARFWVAGLPFLSVGLCYWLSLAKRWWEWLPAAPLAALTLANTVAFAINPLWFLESRQASIPYAALFLWSHVDLNLFLPVDAAPGGIAPYTQPIGALLIYTTLIVALLVACRLQATTSRAVACALTCAVALTPLPLSLARSLPSDTYTIVIHPSEHAIIVRFVEKQKIDAAQFDDQIPAYWTAPPYPKDFTILCLDGRRVIAKTTEPAHPLLTFDHCSNIDRLKIIGTPTGGSDAIYRSVGPIRIIRREL